MMIVRVWPFCDAIFVAVPAAEDGREERTFYRRIITNRFEPQDVGIEEVPTEEITDNTVKSTIYATEPTERGSGYRATFGRHYRPLGNGRWQACQRQARQRAGRIRDRHRRRPAGRQQR